MKDGAIKKVVVLGAGESGNGAALLAKAKGFDVFVSDSRAIAPQYLQELSSSRISFEEGGHTFEKMSDADVVVKSPGIPGSAKIVRRIKEAGIPVVSEIEWAFQFKDEGKIIAVTGTNGKSTTSSLIYHILETSGIDAALVGNIGKSFAKQIALEPKDWYVVELSSFQLDDIQNFRPEVGVILNITPDHLDRYEGKFEKYILAKFRIAENQLKSDFLVLNVDDPAIQQYLEGHQLQPKIAKITMNNSDLIDENGAFMDDDHIHFRLDGEDEKLSIQDLGLRGKHNQYNSMAAGISARATGLRNLKLQESFTTFGGLDHRLEYVATVRGVDFVNDSKGTNMNSVWFALECMVQPVVLILGGQDKGNDYDEIMDLVVEKVRAIVCLGIDNTAILRKFDGVVSQVVETHSAQDAVNAAYALAEKGDVVLLSPGCASFDLFENFEDRGRQFKGAVRNL